MTNKVEVVTVFADKPMPLSDLIRIASRKVKAKAGTSDFINVLDAHYFREQGVYVVLYSVPVFVTVASECEMEQEAR